MYKKLPNSQGQLEGLMFYNFTRFAETPRSLYVALLFYKRSTEPAEGIRGEISNRLLTAMSPLRVRKRANTRILLGDAYVEVVKDSEILPPPRPLPNASDYDTEQRPQTVAYRHACPYVI
jgi:hypothetical protein